MNYNDIKTKLPSSWNDVTLEMYNRILDVQLDASEDGLADTVINLTANLIDVPVDSIYDLTHAEQIDLFNHMSFFLGTKAEPLKQPLKIMNPTNDISLDSYIGFTQLLSTPEKIPYQTASIIKGVVHKDTSTDDILNLSMVEVATVFFFVNKRLRKSMMSLLLSSSIKLMKLRMKQWFQVILGRKNKHK